MTQGMKVMEVMRIVSVNSCHKQKPLLPQITYNPGTPQSCLLPQPPLTPLTLITQKVVLEIVIRRPKFVDSTRLTHANMGVQEINVTMPTLKSATSTGLMVETEKEAAHLKHVPTTILLYAKIQKNTDFAYTLNAPIFT